MSQKRTYTKEETDLMIKMYKDGETYKKIADIIHTKQSKVSSYLKSMGYGKRPKNTLKYHDFLSASRKNKVDENFFDTINTELKAYWLGFLYADGYVHKKYDKNGKEKGGSIELTLKSDDKYHIQNFLDDINSSATIADKTITLEDKKYNANRTCVSSIKMVNDLIKHGCFEKKSLILQPPTTVPEELINHFIRGYFDGDGCVCFYPENYNYTYSILGTKDFLEFIVDKANLTSYKIISFENKKCFELRTYSKKCAEIFHNYLYENKSIYLERKYQKSLAMMKWCGLNDGRTYTQKMADLLDCKLFFDDKNISDFDCYLYTLNMSQSERDPLLSHFRSNCL